jgi:glycerol-3-phosphate O-acyltransferase
MASAALLPDAAQGDGARRLFILDARHGVDRAILTDWVHATWGEAAAGRADEGAVRWISLPIADGDDGLPVAPLAAALGDDPGRLVVPLRVAWRIPDFESNRALGLRQLLFGDPRNPGPLRARAILWRDRRRAQILMGEAATIADLKARFARLAADDSGSEDAFAAFVARQASLALDIAERGVRGSRYKVPRFVAAGLGTSPRFRAALAALGAASGTPMATLRKEAAGYMQELIARPSALFLDLRARFDRFMFGSGYGDTMLVDSAEIERLRATLRQHPTCILFTHKTYIDGATPSRLAYENDLPMLHSFGGANLDFFPIGGFFRRSGMIYIRRSFQDLPVYKLVLRHYIGWLLDKRFPLSWAFEGTRSRLGKLMPPRYGLMKYVLDAAHATATRDVHFVPFVTSFDLIRDVEEYAAEQTGRVKKPESFSWFIGYLRSLREPMGRVRIDIGQPIVIPEVTDPDDKRALERLAFAVAVEANRVTPLTVTGVMCLILLGTAPRGATVAELLVTISYIVDWARARGIRLAQELASGDRDGLRETVDTLVASGLLLRFEQGSERIYSIDPARHAMASYYRGTIVHHFLDRAMIELTLFGLREADGAVGGAFWAGIDRLRDLFKFEFFYPPREAHRAAIAAELARIDAKWEARLESGARGVHQLLRRCQPLVGHAALLQYAEAYSVVFDLLARLDDGIVPDEKAICEAALAEGRQAYLLRRISSEAAIGKLLFANGFALARHLGLVSATDGAQRTARRAMLRELRALAARMEAMRLATVELADTLGGAAAEEGRT